MCGIESAAARRAIAEARRRWLPILEGCVKRDDDGVDEHVHAEIRRLRRLLGLPPFDPSPGMVEQRRRQVRDRVRRFRERRTRHETVSRLATRSAARKMLGGPKTTGYPKGKMRFQHCLERFHILQSRFLGYERRNPIKAIHYLSVDSVLDPERPVLVECRDAAVGRDKIFAGLV